MGSNTSGHGFERGGRVVLAQTWRDSRQLAPSPGDGIECVVCGAPGGCGVDFDESWSGYVSRLTCFKWSPAFEHRRGEYARFMAPPYLAELHPVDDRTCVC